MVAERQLNHFLSIEDVRATSELRTGLTKGIASYAAISAAQRVPVKRVYKISFEGQHLCFIKGETFDEGEVLVYITRTSDVAEGLRQVAERVATGSYKICRVWIEEGSAVKVMIRSTKRKCAIRIWGASAAAQEWIVGRRVGSEQRLARNAA